MSSATFPYQKKHQLVLGRDMAYVEVGGGDPIVFLHGNPASSYTAQSIHRRYEGQDSYTSAIVMRKSEQKG